MSEPPYEEAIGSPGATTRSSQTASGWGQQSLVPVPDPTALTDAAITRATVQYRRELDALRQLLAERIEGAASSTERALQTEIDARDRAIAALRDLMDQRLNDLDQSQNRFQERTTVVVEQAKVERHNEIGALRALLEARLQAMDTATELVARDMKLVPTVMSERLSGLRELIGERIDGIDKATTLRLSEYDKVPALVTAQIDQLRKLHEERFSSIAGQFAERDVRTNQAQQASDQALNAALQAAKELVNAQGEASSAAAVKSETSFTKQIDQIGTIISTLEKALDARITELKERIDRGEGSQSGRESATGSPYEAAIYQQAEAASRAAGQRALVATVIAVVAVLASLVSVIILATRH